MEEEYQQQLIEAQKAREAKEKERANAVEQGDMQKLQELSSVGRGRGGRGRGISNLPAWMTERKDTDFDKNNERIITNEGQFDDIHDIKSSVGIKRKIMNTAPTSILLLKNLVSIEDVDDTLEDEIKNECSKYGKIHQVVIYQVKIDNFPDQERVRLFVEFDNQSSSVLAYKEMNGRFFGGRSIDASFYDEIKFRNKDLAP
jgi:splicing factor 45